MRSLNLLQLILVGLFVCSCTPTTTLRHHTDYKENIKTAREAIVLPAVAEVSMVGVGGKKERMYDYETHIEGIMNDILLSSLTEKGLRVNSLRKKDIHDLKIGNIILNLRKVYNIAREELYSPLGWEHKKAFTIVKNIGGAVKDLKEKIGSDLLIFVDYVGAIKTTGARTLDFAASLVLGSRAVKDADNSSLVIGIVDMRSGNVLWMNLGVVQKSLYDCAFDNFSAQHKVEKETLTKLITQTLVPFAY